MKKIACLVALTLSLGLFSQSFAQKNATARKVQVLDHSANSVRHWRIYVFETIDKQRMALEVLKKNLANVKGILRIEPNDANKQVRFLLYVDESMVLKSSKELLDAFKNSGIELSNIPNN